MRAIGSSTFPAELMVEAQWAAERRGLERFLSEQPRYSMLNRVDESAVLPTARRYGMGILTYGPLSSGWLSGRADPTRGHRSAGAGSRAFDQELPANRAKLEVVRELSELASNPAWRCPLATAFVLAHPAVSAVLLGPRTMEQLESSLAGAARARRGLLDRIDAIVAPGTEPNPLDNYCPPGSGPHPSPSPLTGVRPRGRVQRRLVQRGPVAVHADSHASRRRLSSTTRHSP